MNQTNALQNLVQNADIHAERLKIALAKSAPFLPLTPESYRQLTFEELAYLDVIATRFSKLQDSIGSKIFPAYLDVVGYDTATSYIDKLNYLEKIRFIDNANAWNTLRNIRNELTHEYPDDPVILASSLNKVIPYAQELCELWDKLKEHINKLDENPTV